MKNLYLICNAHLDPVWLWDWEEGIAAALSTFRMAAKFCREYDGFVFNHNEALLYQWVEEYEPALFAEIQELVKLGKWHIMGGWFLQPDCNMPAGESFLRQIEAGREYFREKFGVRPTTAINFDPFGHSRGLVQILKKTGYDSYVFCRPNQNDCPLPDNDFIWVGFDGSEVMGHRSAEGYNSGLGKVDEKINAWIESAGDVENGLLLWGVGNHGGGPSYEDLNKIAQMQTAQMQTEWNFIHAMPEEYFAKLSETKASLPRVEKDLNSWAVGCYTSQARIKQTHRKLENELYLTEKMASQACLAGRMDYPAADFAEAQKALLTSEFHDILPGSAIESVEESAMHLLGHGLELAGRIRKKAFFALGQGQKAAAEGEYPILIYNPHPFPIEGNFCCEFQLADQYRGEKYAKPVVYQNGRRLPGQTEKEACNLTMEWRKKMCFHATLEPSSMNRFGCFIEWHDAHPILPEMTERVWNFVTEDLEVSVNTQTGLLDSLKAGGKEWIVPGAFALEVMESNSDPWGMLDDKYVTEAGRFVLADSADNKHFSGIRADIPSVRVIEHGEAETVVEAVFTYGKSGACIRYHLPAKGTDIDVEVEVDWNERSKFLKLLVPTVLMNGEAMGETAFGIQKYEKTRKECVGLRFAGLADRQADSAFLCINDGTYGMDFEEGKLRISLIHSACYSTHPVDDKPFFKEDRRHCYMDQGKRKFRFGLRMGGAQEQLEKAAREATIFNERPVAVSFFPSGQGEAAGSAVTVTDPAVALVSLRRAAEHRYHVRLFETTGTARSAVVSFPGQQVEKRLTFTPFEIKYLELDTEKGSLTEIPFLSDMEKDEK